MAKDKLTEQQFKMKFYAKLAKEKKAINGNPFHFKYSKEAETAWKAYNKEAK